MTKVKHDLTKFSEMFHSFIVSEGLNLDLIKQNEFLPNFDDEPERT